VRRLLALLLGLVLALPALAIDPLPFRDAEQEARFRALTAELRCVMCQNQSLADSNAMIAQDLRREVFELMQQGKTDQEIKDFLAERYTEFVLYDPPLTLDNLLLWAGPVVLLLIGAITVAVVVARRRRGLEKAPPVPDEEW
jgi:cytochrome c-type biogenesis protein CcmH